MSVSRVSPLPAPRPICGPGCQPLVSAALACGDPILLDARASAVSGGKAVELAVQSAFTGIRVLADREDIHVEHLMPSAEELKAMLRTAAPETFPGLNGRPIVHRHCAWGGAETGLIVLITTGSGTAIDDEFTQPAIQRVATLALQYRPAVVFARELSRIGRGSFVLSPLIEVLDYLRQGRQAGPFIGDEEIRLGELDEGMRARLFLAGEAARSEARRTRSRTAAGRAHTTGEPHPTLPYVWYYGAAGVPPPGLATFRLRGDQMSIGRQAVVIDTPVAWPPPSAVAAGLVPVLDKQGHPADQVALIRWLGEHLFTDGWGLRQAAAEVVPRGWSTPGLRRLHHGAAQTFTLHTGARGRNNGRALDAFVANLDFYRTGTLRVRLGDGAEPVTVPGVLPPDGQPWITEAQYTRITQALQLRRRTADHPAIYLFTGLRVTVNGVPARLVPRHGRHPLRYHLRRADDGRRAMTGRRADALPPLPGIVLATWYAEALAQAAEPLALYLARTADDAPDSLRTELAQGESELAALTAAQARRLSAIDPAQPTYVGHAARALSERYNDDQAKLTRLQARVADLHRQMELQATARPERGIPVTRLVEFAAALGDPYDRGIRVLLQDATEALDLTYRRRPGAGRIPSWEITAELNLRLRDDQDAWRVSHRGRHVAGAVHRVPARLASAVDGLYRGEPLRATLGADWLRWLPEVRQALGCAGPFHLAGCDDPRLLRIGMAVCHPRRVAPPLGDDPTVVARVADPAVDPNDLPRLARRLGEPVALLRLVHAQFATSTLRQARWRHNPAPALATAYQIAAEHGGVIARAAIPCTLRRRLPTLVSLSRLSAEWTVPPRGPLVLRRCRRCHSHRRAVSRLRVVNGSLCLGCRTDRAGVHWDLDYDRYLDMPYAHGG